MFKHIAQISITYNLEYQKKHTLFVYQVLGSKPFAKIYGTSRVRKFNEHYDNYEYHNII